MPRPALALLVITLGTLELRAQNPILEVDPAPGGTSEWVSTPFIGQLVVDIQARLTGTAGGWGTILVGAHIEESQGTTWKDEPPTSDPTQFAGWFGGASPAYRIPQPVFEAGTQLGLLDLASGSPHPHAVQDWYVPILTGTLGGPRVWNSHPEIWTNSITGLGYGAIHSAYWDAMTAEYPTGNIQDPTLLSVESLARYGLLLRAMLDGSGIAAVNEYFDKVDYTQDLVGLRVIVTLQGITVMSGLVVTPGTHDLEAPTLEGYPTVDPIHHLTNAIGMAVHIPAPLGELIHHLTGTVTRGEKRRFSAARISPPAFVEFQTESGRKKVRIKSASSRSDPISYTVRVPDDVIQGSITLTTGIHTTPVYVGEITEVLPTGT